MTGAIDPTTRELIEATVNIKKVMMEISSISSRLQKLELESAANRSLLDSLKEDQKEIKETFEELKEELDGIHEMATKWRGGIAVILALGGIIGYGMSFLTNIMKLHN